MRCFRYLTMLFAVSISLLCPGKTLAYSIVYPASSVLNQSADRFAVGQSLVNSKTPTLSLQELVDRVAGKPSRSAYIKYGGDLASYWETASAQRAGKTFEAMIAYRDNHPGLWKRLLRAARGNKDRIVVTAAEGASGHPADLLKIDKHGVIVHQYQLKLGWQETVKALQKDSKYAGMSILTTQDSLEIIQKKLLQAEQAAQRLLESIDRDERYHATRRYLLYAMNSLREPPTGSR